MNPPAEGTTTAEPVPPIIHRTPTGEIITSGMVEEMFRACSQMANRRNANVTADIKASRGVRGLREFAADVQMHKNRLALDISKERIGERAPAELSDLENQIIMAAIEVARAEYDQEPFDDPTFKLPSVRFMEADLPKEMTGEAGWKNAAGIGAIVADLGPLYDLPKD